MNQDSNSGGKPRKGYTEEFKRSVVDHWFYSGKTAAQVAQKFGVKVWNIWDWRRRYGPTQKPVDAPLPQSPQEMAREIQQLRKELAPVHWTLTQVSALCRAHIKKGQAFAWPFEIGFMKQETECLWPPRTGFVGHHFR